LNYLFYKFVGFLKRDLSILSQFCANNGILEGGLEVWKAYDKTALFITKGCFLWTN